MKTIHKYTLSADTVIDTYLGFKFLSLQMQNGGVSLWAEVDTSKPKMQRRIICFGTGHEIPDNVISYIGTVQIDSSLVFHFYEAAIRESME